MQPYEFLAAAADLVNKSTIPPDQALYLAIVNGELGVIPANQTKTIQDVIFKFYPRHRTEGLSAKEWYTVFSRMMKAYMEGRLH